MIFDDDEKPFEEWTSEDWAAEKRELKADRLIRWFIREGHDIDHVAELTGEQWRSAARAAGVNEPSEACRVIVRGKLQVRKYGTPERLSREVA